MDVIKKVRNCFAILITAVLLLNATACALINPSSNEAAGETERVTADTSGLTAEAYMVVFKEFYPPESIKKSSGEEFYISVDLAKVMQSNTDVIKEKIEDYLSGSRVILLWDDMDALIEGGYIRTEWGNPVHFENGKLFSFEDISLLETKLHTKASQWYGSLGADGSTFVVEKKSGIWEITSVTESWIS